MIRFRWHFTLAIAVFLAGAPSLYAQRGTSVDPHVGYVFPAGGQQGKSFDVIVGGQNLKEATEAYISGGGVKVKVGGWYRPMTQGEYNRIRMKIRFKREELEKAGKGGITEEALHKMLGVTENDLKEMAIYEKRRADPKRQPNVQIADELTLHVQVEAGARLGDRELRVITPTGMSNPLWFFVSQWPEVRETEPNDIKPDRAIGYDMPIVVNGQCMPGDVDRFAFSARKGTRLVISAAARELIPYLADGVPGWFQAVLALFDSKGNEVAYSGAYHFRQDPLIYYEVPEDGEYVVQIHDSVFRGREDFVYRITLGELPIVTGVFPMGGKANTDLDVELLGWNLKETHLNIKATPDRNRLIRWYLVPQNEKVSVRFPLRIESWPEVMEQEPNDTAEAAQSVSMPIVINGRIQKPDDVDVYRFHAAGRFVAEVFARRLGSPLDSTLTAVDAKGKELGFNDDSEDKSQPLLTHHADSMLTVTPSSNGMCFLRVADSQRKGGPDFTYRLYLRAPHPDFQLRVVPSSIIAHPGSCIPITVHALRTEGHADDIGLALVKAPPGFKLDGFIIPGNQDKVRLTLTVPPVATPEPILLEMEGYGSGNRGGPRVTRYAVPSEAMTQAFFYQHLVPVKDWTIMLSGSCDSKPPLMFPQGIRLQLGVPTTFPVMVTGNYPAPSEVTLELSEPPDGMLIDKVTPQGRALAVTISSDDKKVKPGQRGNLIFKVFREWTPPATKEKEVTKSQRQAMGVVPAVPFEVVGGKTAPRKK